MAFSHVPEGGKALASNTRVLRAFEVRKRLSIDRQRKKFTRMRSPGASKTRIIRCCFFSIARVLRGFEHLVFKLKHCVYTVF